MLQTPELNLSLDEFCLFIDADGTLLDIAARPEHVRVSQFLLTILDDVYIALNGLLAVVSGRRIEDIDRLFSPLRLPASGTRRTTTPVAGLRTSWKADATLRTARPSSHRGIA